MNCKTKILAILMAATMLLSACGDSGETSSTTEDSSSLTTSTSTSTSTAVDSSEENVDSTVESSTAESSSEPAPVVDPYAGLTSYQDKLSVAKGINSDTKAWLSIPGTTVDSPVLQASNNEYYLKLDEYKNYSIFGCYFFDYENSLTARSNLSKNTIIYGHSDLKDNANGVRFSQLFHYLDADFLAENSDLHLSIAGEDMVFRIFAVFHTHTDFNYIEANPTEADFQTMLNGVAARNEYITDVTATASDKILTLSTCSSTYNTGNTDDYRLVVMGKLLPAGDTGESNITVSVNPNPLKS